MKLFKSLMSRLLSSPSNLRQAILLASIMVMVQFSPGVLAQATISTVAGGGFGSNVPARLAPMVQPTITVFDPLGRGVYVVDEVNGSSLLRFVNTTSQAVTLGGVTILPQAVNLIGGGGTSFDDGVTALDADLAQVTGLAVSASGNLVYLSIPAYSTIRVLNVGTEAVESYGRSIKPQTIDTLATLNFIDFRGLTLNRATGELYFIAGRVVYKLNLNLTLTAVAGGGNPATGNGDGGEATQARLISPMGLAFDLNNNLLIAEGGDPRTTRGSVRRVNVNNIISSLAAGLEFPTGIAVGPNGDAFLPLGNAQQVIRVTQTGVKTVVAGDDSPQLCDLFNNPTCGDGGLARNADLNLPDSTANITIMLAVDARGVYLPDYRFKRVRFINLSTIPVNILDTSVTPQHIATIIGNGLTSPYDGSLATHAELFVPTGIAVDGSGNLFIADTGYNRLRFVNRTTAPVTLFVTTPYALTVQPGQIVTLNKNVGDPITDQRITTAFFLSPQGMAATPQGILIVDSQAGALIKTPPNSLSGRRSGVLRFLNTSNSPVTFFPDNGEARVVILPGHINDIAGVRPPMNPQELGDGLSANKVAFFPTDVAIDRAGNIYLADQGNNRIRRLDARTGIVSTVYGDGTTATLWGATGIGLDTTDRLYLADTRNNRILRQNAPGDNTFTIIGNQSLGINRPRDLAVDARGRVFVSNILSQQIVRLDAPTNALGTLTVVAGNGKPGFSGDDGPATAARLNLPDPGVVINDIQVTTSLVTLPNGDLLLTDTNNNRIRQLKGLSGTLPLANVSAASYRGTELASEMIVAAFGEKLSTETLSASSVPLPTTLGGTRVTITDAVGIERPAPLFYVSPQQINYQIPPGAVLGPALITATSGDGTISTEAATITTVAPGIFSANATSRDIAAAQVLRIKADGSAVYESVYQYDSVNKLYVPAPIDVGPETDQLILVLFGTGIRFRSALSSVTTTIGGEFVETLYAGPSPDYIGLDQCNVRLPRRFAGRGLLNVEMTVDGKRTNIVTIQMK